MNEKNIEKEFKDRKRFIIELIETIYSKDLK